MPLNLIGLPQRRSKTLIERVIERSHKSNHNQRPSYHVQRILQYFNTSLRTGGTVIAGAVHPQLMQNWLRMQSGSDQAKLPAPTLQATSRRWFSNRHTHMARTQFSSLTELTHRTPTMWRHLSRNVQMRLHRHFAGTTTGSQPQGNARILVQRDRTIIPATRALLMQHIRAGQRHAKPRRPLAHRSGLRSRLTHRTLRMPNPLWQRRIAMITQKQDALRSLAVTRRRGSPRTAATQAAPHAAGVSAPMVQRSQKRMQSPQSSMAQDSPLQSHRLDLIAARRGTQNRHTDAGAETERTIDGEVFPPNTALPLQAQPSPPAEPPVISPADIAVGLANLPLNKLEVLTDRVAQNLRWKQRLDDERRGIV